MSAVDHSRRQAAATHHEAKPSRKASDRAIVFAAAVVMAIGAGGWIRSAAGAEDRPAAGEAASDVAGKTEPYLGVFTAPVGDALRSQLGDKLAPDEGLIVVHVLPGSPAFRAGIERHDVLTRLGDTPVGDAERLKARIAAARPGETIAAELIRRFERKTVVLTVEMRDAASPEAASGALGYRLDSRKLAVGAAGTRVAPEADRPASDDRQVAADGPAAGDRSLRIVTADGQRFEVELHYTNREGGRESLRRSGTPAEIVARSAGLPAELRDEIAGGLDEAAGERERGRGVRFRLQPGLQGARRNVRLQLGHQGQAGETRLVAVEQSVDADRPLDVDRLLDDRQFADELERLAPEVRRQVEQTLRTTELPQVRVRVRNSQ